MTVTEYIDQAIRQLPDRTSAKRPALPSPELVTPVLPYRTALEIVTSTPEQPDWLVHGFVARQAITEVDGAIKRAGKTTWVTHLVRSVLHGEPFMGAETVESNVVYLTEQSRGSFREALRRAELLDRGDELRVLLRRDIVGMPWDELIAQVARDAIGDGYGLLVVDTLASWPGSARRMTQAPLRSRWRHSRMPPTTGWASSSAAMSGDVDIILSLRRPEGNQRATLRELHSLSRYDDTPDRRKRTSLEPPPLPHRRPSAIVARTTSSYALELAIKGHSRA